MSGTFLGVVGLSLVLFRSISFVNLSSESFVLNAIAQFSHLYLAGIIPAAGVAININLNQ